MREERLRGAVPNGLRSDGGTGGDLLGEEFTGDTGRPNSPGELFRVRIRRRKLPVGSPCGGGVRGDKLSSTLIRIIVV